VAVAILAVLSTFGLLSLLLLVADGAEPRARWGYPAATLAFLLSAAQAAPILALVSRLGRGFWGIPFRRPAELLAVAGLVTAPLFILVALQLPPPGERPSIWFHWPGAPVLWDGLAVVLLALLGLALLHASSLPDRQAGRPAGWTGARRQWRVLSSGVVLLGALYATLFIFVHLLLVGDLALSLVPGWGSAVMPAFHAVSAFQAGLATAVLAAAWLRRSTRWRAALDPTAFHAAGKLLLAMALLWFYFWWSEFLTYWYGATPEERWLLELLVFGPYFGPFLVAFGLCFALPTLLLIWNRVRNSVAGPTFAAALVLVGSFADRIRIFVAAWSVAHLPPDAVRTAQVAPVPPLQLPSLLDLLVLLGAPAAVLLLCLLALRLVPPVSLWEHHWGERLRVERPYLDTEVEILARPS
jgi:molybdopterin-containing oxidoreductase family membrane subunit